MERNTIEMVVVSKLVHYNTFTEYFFQKALGKRIPHPVYEQRNDPAIPRQGGRDQLFGQSHLLRNDCRIVLVERNRLALWIKDRAGCFSS